MVLFMDIDDTLYDTRAKLPNGEKSNIVEILKAEANAELMLNAKEVLTKLHNEGVWAFCVSARGLLLDEERDISMHKFLKDGLVSRHIPIKNSLFAGIWWAEDDKMRGIEKVLPHLEQTRKMCGEENWKISPEEIMFVDNSIDQVLNVAENGLFCMLFCQNEQEKRDFDEANKMKNVRAVTSWDEIWNIAQNRLSLGKTSHNGKNHSAGNNK